MICGTPLISVDYGAFTETIVEGVTGFRCNTLGDWVAGIEASKNLDRAKAALVLGRPVKICLTREEVFYQHRGRHPVLMRFRTGVSKDGKLTAMHLQTLLDGGGYG